MKAEERRSEEAKLVVFQLAHELYGADIALVRGLEPLERITRVPRTPPYIAGVTNLRGRVIPVLDLRRRLGLPAAGVTKASRIAVTETTEWGTVGMIVDGVSEVLRVPAEAIEPCSPVLTNVDSDYVKGVAKVNERLIILLDLGKVLARGRDAHALAV